MNKGSLPGRKLLETLGMDRSNQLGRMKDQTRWMSQAGDNRVNLSLRNMLAGAHQSQMKCSNNKDQRILPAGV
jgi:hypothetical protein